MKYFLLCIFPLVLMGCASNYIKVTEYASETSSIPFISPKIGGCIAEIEGDLSGVSFKYVGDRCEASNK